MKTLIAIPTLSTVHVQFMTSLMAMEKPPGTALAIEMDSLVYIARGNLVMKAIEGEFDNILWIDSDMIFAPDLLTRMQKHAEDGKQFVTALCFRRNLPTSPVICKELEWEQSAKGFTSQQRAYMDYPQNSVFEIAGAGFGCCLTSLDLITRLAKAYGTSPFTPMPSLSEDFSFCWRVREIGEKMWCDSSIKLGHIGTLTYDENLYLSQRVTQNEAGKSI